MLDPKDIDSITTVGYLGKDEVKMLKTRGGYHIFTHGDKVLMGSSHRAIGLHKIGKAFPSFKNAMQKSEQEKMPAVTDLTRYLTGTSKFEIYSMQKGEDIEATVCKYGTEVMSVLLKKESDGVYTHGVKKTPTNLSQAEKEEIADGLSKACIDLAKGK